MTTPPDQYTRAAQTTAESLIRAYSTSFWLATRTLPQPTRARIASLYALVRLADEIVDGAFPLNPAAQLTELNDLHARVTQAVHTGHSSDLVVHAFAQTARACALTAKLWDPFFDSMRTDLTTCTHTRESLRTYIYGSAEVIGLMCVHIFYAGPPPNPHLAPHIFSGARALGDAFQRINFLRDYATDRSSLGRSYLGELTEERKAQEVAHIRSLFATATPAIELLPHRTRCAVRAATALFRELTDRVEATSVTELTSHRVRVPGPRKLALTARAALGPLS